MNFPIWLGWWYFPYRHFYLWFTIQFCMHMKAWVATEVTDKPIFPLWSGFEVSSLRTSKPPCVSFLGIEYRLSFFRWSTKKWKIAALFSPCFAKSNWPPTPPLPPPTQLQCVAMRKLIHVVIDRVSEVDHVNIWIFAPKIQWIQLKLNFGVGNSKSSCRK